MGIPRKPKDWPVIDRRQALKAMGGFVAVAGSPAMFTACSGARPMVPVDETQGVAFEDPAPLKTNEIRALVQDAVATAKGLGATFADARVQTKRDQRIITEDRRVMEIKDSESRGIGLRVVVDGALGFAATADLSADSVASIAAMAVEIGRASASLSKGSPLDLAEEPRHEASFTSPRERNPFDVPIDQKVSLMLAAAEKMLAVPSVGKAIGFMNFLEERRTIANSEGSLIETDMLRTRSGIRATAIGDGDAVTRGYFPPPLSGGYEIIQRANFVDQAERVGQESVEKLRAAPVSDGKTDLILLPSHLWLTIHESIGHATELDRALGMEESLSGGSFATVDQLGKLRYGSKLINVRGLNTKPDFLASVGYDDDGVACRDFDIIRGGVLTGYSTSREVAHAAHETRSVGACRADAWSSIPILRMANVCLMPGEERASQGDLIADTKRGILIDGAGSFSIDNKRLNFQFGGDAFWEINNGKRTRMLRDVTYHAITPQFWGACNAIADEREWRPYGTFSCGKGDPMQSSQISPRLLAGEIRWHHGSKSRLNPGAGLMKNWKREELNKLIDLALEASTADHALVTIRGYGEGGTRFALSEINQNVFRSDLSLDVQVAFGTKVGRATTNTVTHSGFADCVKRAEAIARLSEPDPEFMPPVPSMALPQVNTWDQATAETTPTHRAAVVKEAVTVSEKAGASGAGSYITRADVVALGNKVGHRAFDKATQATLLYSATAGDSVGWASSYARHNGGIDVASVARRATQKALDGRNPRDFKPGRCDVILEPAAVAGLMGTFFWYQLDAKATDEGRTFLKGKVGQKIASPAVNVYSDPTLATCPSVPFDEDGMKLDRVDWIRDGVLENLRYSRFWAQKQHKAFTGAPANVIIGGGDSTVAEMIKATKRGIWVTRLWYIRAVDPMRDLFTGMTRDGTFLVENGEVVGPVKNLRFNDSPTRLFSSVELLGEAQTITNWGFPTRAPFLMARDFNFTSSTEF